MKQTLLFLTLFVTWSPAAVTTQCYRYPTAGMVVEASHEGKVTGTRELKNLEIYYFPDRDETHAITIGYILGSTKMYNNDVFCRRDAHGSEECGVECDGGTFEVRKDFAVRVHDLWLFRSEEGNATRPDLLLRARDGRAFIRGEPFACPLEIPRMNDGAYKDDPGGENVCYLRKVAGRYTGCFRTMQLCEEIGVPRFGNYPNLKASEAAWKRCVASAPKQQRQERRKNESDTQGNRNRKHCICNDGMRGWCRWRRYVPEAVHDSGSHRMLPIGQISH